MNEFSEFLKLGFHHILDFSSLDHLLFIGALTIGYGKRDINKLILVLTAFTIGHAITLGLTVSDMLFLDNKYVEIFIPITIIVTAVYHLTNINNKDRKVLWVYLFTISFGLIHGMGYADTFKSLYSETSKMWRPLLEFNLGVELGQLLAALVIWKVGRLIKRLTGISDKKFKVISAGVIISVASIILFKNLG